jgi:hypothetical protein
MKKKKKFIIIIPIILISILTISIIFIFFNPLLKIKLIGKDETIEVFTSYKDKGVKIEGTKNKVKTINKVNTNKLGTYTITYKIKHLKTTKIVKRKVTIIDKTPPTITLKENDITIYQNDTYIEPGYKAEDNYGMSYYFRGSVQDNYVLFNNMCFRIVRIEGDGSVKLIYAGDVSEGATNCNEVGETTGLLRDSDDNVISSLYLLLFDPPRALNINRLFVTVIYPCAPLIFAQLYCLTITSPSARTVPVLPLISCPIRP